MPHHEWYHSDPTGWYRSGMAMNLRLRDDQTEALKLRAEQEGTSMHAILLRAVDDYLSRTAQEAIVRKTAMDQAAKWHELMERLK